jgi:hypothetical protein
MEVNCRLRGTCHLCPQGRRISSACCLLYVIFCLDLVLQHEDGGGTFLRNVSYLSPNDMELYLKIYISK